MLRKMVDELERSEWLRAASVAAWFHRSMTGEVLDPNDMIPESLKPRPVSSTPPRTPERERHDTAAALMLIGEALKGRK
jgi:hypothetical protein